MQEISRRKPILKNRVAPEIEEAILAQRSSSLPAQFRVANQLRKRKITVSHAGVRCVWQRHELKAMANRLDALEAKSAQDGLVLPEARVVALERQRSRRSPLCQHRSNIGAVAEIPRGLVHQPLLTDHAGSAC